MTTGGKHEAKCQEDKEKGDEWQFGIVVEEPQIHSLPKRMRGNSSRNEGVLFALENIHILF